QLYVNKPKVVIENFARIPVTQANIKQVTVVMVAAGHSKPIHEHDDVYFRDCIIPFLPFAFGSLVGNQLTSIIQHPALQMNLGAALHLDEDLLTMSGRAAKIEDNPTDFIGIARMLVLVIYQIRDFPAATENTIQ